MKIRNLALVLATAALLPTFAYADAVLASFERDMNREPTVARNTSLAITAKPVDAINTAL